MEPVRKIVLTYFVIEFTNFGLCITCQRVKNLYVAMIGAVRFDVGRLSRFESFKEHTVCLFHSVFQFFLFLLVKLFDAHSCYSV